MNEGWPGEQVMHVGCCVCRMLSGAVGGAGSLTGLVWHEGSVEELGWSSMGVVQALRTGETGACMAHAWVGERPTGIGLARGGLRAGENRPAVGFAQGQKAKGNRLGLRPCRLGMGLDLVHFWA